MTRAFADDLSSLLDQINDTAVDIRHDLHAHPELSFEEHRTTRVVRERLTALGWSLAPCPTETGVVATLAGSAPGRRVMVRADIDGLPVDEEVDLPYRSVNGGVMHACGHDVHTAALLTVADLLARRHDELAGEFTLVFQPAEEALGGARTMIEGGVLDDHPVDYFLAAHVASIAPVGIVATKAGIMMSEATSLLVRIHGRGGHGAYVTREGNVVLALSELAPRLDEVVTDLAFEGTDCACSAGVITAGTANNVVPRHATLRGTLRTFTPDQRVRALDRLTQLLREVSDAFGVECTLATNDAAPAVANDTLVVDRVLARAGDVVGTSRVLTIPPTTGSDDASEFLNRVPGCYVFVGGGLPDGSSGMHHSPDFAVDDGACRIMAGVLAASAVDLAQS